MKWSYALVFLFAFWSWTASQWYLVEVKGLSTEIADFSEQDSTMAILEIVVILLVAFLIGFVAAWLARKRSIENLTVSISQLVEASKKAERHQKETDQNELARLKQHNESIESEIENVRKDRLELERLAQNYLSELDTLRNRTQRLEAESAHLKLRSDELETELSATKSKTKKILTSAREGDDLMHIKGIGPVISRKLNGAGIFSFQQVANLDEATIERLSKSILHFPKRIQRDRWREQAAELAQQKKDE